jgi:hypothetical protein
MLQVLYISHVQCENSVQGHVKKNILKYKCKTCQIRLMNFLKSKNFIN